MMNRLSKAAVLRAVYTYAVYHLPRDHKNAYRLPDIHQPESMLIPSKAVLAPLIWS